MSHIILKKLSELSSAVEKLCLHETLLTQALDESTTRLIELQARYDAALAAIAALESKITGEIKALDLELKNVYSKLTAANETIAVYERFTKKVAEIKALKTTLEQVTDF